MAVLLQQSPRGVQRYLDAGWAKLEMWALVTVTVMSQVGDCWGPFVSLPRLVVDGPTAHPRYAYRLSR